ncbi:MAG: Hpt domain-containing protein [Thermoguttaceae bacterium]
MSQEVFDIATLLSQCGGKKEIAGMVLDEFVTQTPADVAAIAKSLADADASAVSKAAHRLKGTAGVIGAHTFHQLCFDVELAGKNGDLAAAATAFVLLEAEAKKCLDFVPTAKATM